VISMLCGVEVAMAGGDNDIVVMILSCSYVSVIVGGGSSRLLNSAFER
jgi:hypothetical protein